jgi:hypothetical protein
MKKSTVFSVLMICFALCSCINNPREETGAVRLSDTEDLTREITAREMLDTDTLFAETNAQEMPLTNAVPEKPRLAAKPEDETPPVPSAPYPAFYRDAPEEYKAALDALFLLEANMLRGEERDAEDLDAVGFSEYPYPPKYGDTNHADKLCYALTDLNGDGVLELLLGTMDGLNNAAPHSIFTIIDGHSVHLESYWSRSKGVIAADGTIYCMGSGGAPYTYLSSYKLDEGGESLIQLTDIHSDLFYDDSRSEYHPYFVQVVDGRNRYITEDEFSKYAKFYLSPPERLKLNVIPVNG